MAPDTITNGIEGAVKGPVMLLVLAANGAAYAVSRGVNLMLGGYLAPETVTLIESVTQVLSLATILGTMAWHLLIKRFITTEEERRQQQIDRALRHLSEHEGAEADVEITEEGAMRVLYRLRSKEGETIDVDDVQNVIEEVRENA